MSKSTSWLPVESDTADEMQRWAETLGVDCSEVLGEVIRRHPAVPAGEHDAHVWERLPLTDAESAIADAASWGPSEDWEDWAEAEG